MSTAPRVNEVLGVDESESELELLQRVRSGLPYETVKKIRRELDLTLEQLADALAISTRTLNRRRRDETLSPDESDRVFRIARVYTHALDVLGDGESASRWLKRSNAALDGQAPIELFDTDLGAKMVDDVLTRIEFGVYS